MDSISYLEIGLICLSIVLLSIIVFLCIRLLGIKKNNVKLEKHEEHFTKLQALITGVDGVSSGDILVDFQEVIFEPIESLKAKLDMHEKQSLVLSDLLKMEFDGSDMETDISIEDLDPDIFPQKFIDGLFTPLRSLFTDHHARLKMTKSSEKRIEGYEIEQQNLIDQGSEYKKTMEQLEADLKKYKLENQSIQPLQYQVQALEWFVRYHDLLDLYSENKESLIFIANGLMTGKVNNEMAEYFVLQLIKNYVKKDEGGIFEEVQCVPLYFFVRNFCFRGGNIIG